MPLVVPTDPVMADVLERKRPKTTPNCSAVVQGFSRHEEICEILVSLENP